MTQDGVFVAGPHVRVSTGLVAAAQGMLGRWLCWRLCAGARPALLAAASVVPEAMAHTHASHAACMHHGMPDSVLMR